MIANLVIQEGSWDLLKPQLIPIRTAVFIVEQEVPVALEWDEDDAKAVHLLALNQKGQAVGCARIVNAAAGDVAKLGRMAVLSAERNQGYGQALLANAITLCQKERNENLVLSAQMHAIPFYEKFEFKVVSERYLDAGIWHVDMIRTLNQ
jgi:predicted GNAT family N-acyltransferase